MAGREDLNYNKQKCKHMEDIDNSLTAIAEQDGHSISVIGSTYRIIIGGEQTNGAYALIEMLIPPKGGPGPHSHPTFQEAYYIIDGEIKVTTKEKKYTATKGTYLIYRLKDQFINLPT
jgi:quercetin dioxygenase-like cupin family protein